MQLLSYWVLIFDIVNALLWLLFYLDIMGDRPSKLTFSVLKISVTAQQNKASVVFQLLLDMLLKVMLQDLTCTYAFVVIYFNKTRKKIILNFGYLKKHKKIPFVPQDCPLLNK